MPAGLGLKELVILGRMGSQSLSVRGSMLVNHGNLNSFWSFSAAFANDVLGKFCSLL